MISTTKNIENYLKSHILANQTSLVDILIENGEISDENDITNIYYYPCPNCGGELLTITARDISTCIKCNKECNSDIMLKIAPELRDIKEYYLIDEWLADRLNYYNSCVVTHQQSQSKWWGRTETTENIYTDNVLIDIYQDSPETTKWRDRQ